MEELLRLLVHKVDSKLCEHTLASLEKPWMHEQKMLPWLDQSAKLMYSHPKERFKRDIETTSMSDVGEVGCCLQPEVWVVAGAWI